MINRVVLVGRITKKPELKVTQGGASVTEFTLAVERQFKGKDGNRDADFIRCVAWRKTAEIITKYTDKGSQIGVDGRIQTRSYDNQDGQRVYVTEVVVENVSLLGSKNGTSQQNNQQRQQTSQNYGNSYTSSNLDDLDDLF